MAHYTAPMLGNTDVGGLSPPESIQRLRAMGASAPARRIDVARSVAEVLLVHFGLIGWRFLYMSRRATGRFGDCNHSRKIIRLSPVLTEMNDFVEIEDTIRHEIAHALCDPSDGHNRKFYAMCRKVGARPERCCGSEVKCPRRKSKSERLQYRRRCIRCEISQHFRGRISAVRACGRCGSNLLNERRGSNGWEPRSKWSGYCGWYACWQMEEKDMEVDDPQLGVIAQVSFNEPVCCGYCRSRFHDWEWEMYE